MDVEAPIVSDQLFIEAEHGRKPVAIRLYRPVPGDRCWECRYEIDWPDGRRSLAIAGEDAVQALVLALQIVGAELYSSIPHREGRLRKHEDEEGYGFPLPASLRHLAVGVDAQLPG